MPTISEFSIAAVSINGLHDGQQVLLTTHWRLYFGSGVSDDPEMVAACDAINESIDGLDGLNIVYAGAVSSELVAMETWIQIVHPNRYVKRVYGFQAGHGEGPAPAMPPNVAHVITLQTDLTGRTQIGNKHIGCVPSTFTLNGSVTDVGMEAYSALKIKLSSTIGTTIDALSYDWRPVIYHRVAPGASVEVTGGRVQQTTRVERRRTVGQGS